MTDSTKLAGAVITGTTYIVASLVTLTLLHPTDPITTWNAGAVTALAAWWSGNKFEEINGGDDA